jgi:glutamate synthase (NADPH/NADH) small chain
MTDSKGFLKFERQEISRRSVQERLQDWTEVDLKPHSELLQKQSSRCMDCGVAFCQGDTGCPVNNLIPEWNDLVSQNRWQEAAARLLSTNNFPEFTGRLCPAPCESACVLGVHSDPVNIKAMEWGIIDKAFENGWVPSQKSQAQSGKHIAVIGSGPAGLTVAQQLARSGHQVTVFEKAKLIGGLLRYGIPDFKLQKSLIDRRVLQMQEEGVKFKTSVNFGSDLNFNEIKKEFDALVLATGAEVPRDLAVPGRNLAGIHFAMDFLTEQNQLLGGEISNLSINAFQKRVVILGGGDTGSDCLGTALRQGASQVLQFEIQSKPPQERDPQTPWPLWPMKLKSSHAHEEGGLRQWSLATQEFLGQGGVVQKLRTQRLDTKEEHLFDADLVILAMGFTGAHRKLAQALPGLSFTSQGALETESNFMTSVEGVFACGDTRRGASLIVWAIAEGRRLADSVHQYLQGQSLRSH